jgi:Erythromycin biosynthesis protein CIII-like, C-terminal domain/Erythromycin biosynthesis protein CIII-like, N-terminal domain
MRVLFTTTPGRGHWQPMLPLGQALRAAGHEVRWAAAEEVCRRLREEGFDAVGSGRGATELPVITPPPPEIASLPAAERPEFLFARFFGPRRAEPMIADLVPIVEDWQPQLLVCDQAELAGPIAAARAGVPNVTHAFGHLLPAKRVMRAGDAVADLWRAHGLEPRPFAGMYDHIYLDIYPPSLQTDDIGHVGEIQLLRPALISKDGLPDPLVYITFGTVWNEDLSLFSTAVEAARELPVRVVVTLGPGHDPGELGEQPANVRVADFIPQEQLLPECAAVVSHAGSGTFLATLSAGVPQLLLPLAADQFLNAEAAARGGVALVLRPGEVSVSSVRDALRKVLADASLREAAERVSAEMDAMPSPQDVAAELTRRFR